MTTAALLVLGASLACQTPVPDEFLTVAEKSGFQRTATFEEVSALSSRLAEGSRTLRLETFGTTVEGRALPMLIASDPPAATAEEARKAGKLVALLFGNIHAGEVCGKEALPMLAREIRMAEGGAGVESAAHPLLKDWVLILVPILNADGNERVGPVERNRPGQNGPAETGIRSNAAGLDLNRDWSKLESPEVRAIARLLRGWDPDVVIDTHTTNGSRHQYTLTYGASKHPAGDAGGLNAFASGVAVEAGRRLEGRTGYKAFFYGYFNRDKTEWLTYPAQIRYGTNLQGVRGHVGLLSEAYSYAPFEDRVRSTLEFCRASLEVAAERRAEMERVREAARRPPDRVALRVAEEPLPEPETVLGFEDDRDPNSPSKTFEVRRMDGRRIEESAARPWGYYIPPGYPEAVDNLRRHGIASTVLREDREADDVEWHAIEGIETADRPFQGHALRRYRTRLESGAEWLRAGGHVVRTDQPLSALACLLLEPGSEDGLGAWNFFDEGAREGGKFPVFRLKGDPGIPSSAAPALAEDRPAPRRLNRASRELAAGLGGGFGFGEGRGGYAWIDEDHWLERRGNGFVKVRAATGRRSPAPEAEANLEAATAALAKALGGDAGQARSALGRVSPASWFSGRGAAMAAVGNDLYFVKLDGSDAGRFTNTPREAESNAEMSPDGRFAAYTRGGDLWIASADGRDARVTTDGGGTVRNGEASYVYYEEVFDRSWKAFWWSPDSKRVAFLRFDDAPVPPLPVFDAIGFKPSERPAYPRVGDPNPLARLGFASAETGEAILVELPEHREDEHLIVRAHWHPSGDRCLAYVTDRIQSWMDVVEVSFAEGGAPRVRTLFREKTGAWVEVWDPPFFLKDGTMLFQSERDGWKHLYRYGPNGESLGATTSGEWAIDSVLRVDEEEGRIYFTARIDAPLNPKLHRIGLDGTNLECLTPEPGSHSASLSPGAKWVVDAVSDFDTPGRTTLRSTRGEPGRVLDANPARLSDGLELGAQRLASFPARDGYTLFAEVYLPPDLDPSMSYPVYVSTYGGPRAPVVRDSWGGGHLSQHMMAGEGFVVMRVDPRSASNRGAVSAWSAYKRLGVQELKDLEDAVDWLAKEYAFVDPARVGIEGMSYGGYMAAFALTHSKKFAAGVAGAPVTDWNDYDSIYTERYMDLPSRNPEGYRASSAVQAAAALEGRLLLIHGARDHNVPIHNTMKLAQRLQMANKSFEMMIYPTAAHGGFGRHQSDLSFDFIKRSLGGPRPRSSEPRDGEIAAGGAR